MKKEEIKLYLEDIVQNSKNPIIIGGHYSLMNNLENPNELIPSIIEQLTDRDLKKLILEDPFIGIFPSETFLMSLGLLKINESARILFLVNDWQNVLMFDVMTKGQMRRNYFQKNELPKSYLKQAEKQNINLCEKVFPAPKKMSYHGSQLFSETILRNKYENSSILKSCPLGTSCAQEMLPLLIYCSVHTQDFIGILPITCMEPILEACTTFKEKFNRKMKINLVFPTNPTSKEDFWNDTKIFEF